MNRLYHRRAAQIINLVIASGSLSVAQAAPWHQGQWTQHLPGGQLPPGLSKVVGAPQPARQGSAARTLPDRLWLMEPADVQRLRTQSPADLQQLIKTCQGQLNYQGRAVATLSPGPHYTAGGPTEPEAEVKQLANDANAAYRNAVCYVATQDARYARTTQRILDNWASTLRRVDNRQGQNVLNFNMPFMIVAASWVRDANQWDSRNFDQFLRNFVLPRSMSNTGNNHGFWGVLMDTTGAVYLGDRSKLQAAHQRWRVLVNETIDQNGVMPHEIQRSDTSNWTGGPTKGAKGIAYTHYALQPASVTAQLFAQAGMPVWQTAEGARLQKAFAQVAHWTRQPETFPYYASNKGKLEGVRQASYFKILQRVYPNADAAAVIREGNFIADRFLLKTLF